MSWLYSFNITDIHTNMVAYLQHYNYSCLHLYMIIGFYILQSCSFLKSIPDFVFHFRICGVDCSFPMFTYSCFHTYKTTCLHFYMITHSQGFMESWLSVIRATEYLLSKRRHSLFGFPLVSIIQTDDRSLYCSEFFFFYLKFNAFSLLCVFFVLIV